MTQEDFMVVGRLVPWFLLVGTLVFTWIGSSSLFGAGGHAFREGFSVLWKITGASIFYLIVVNLLTPHLLEEKWESFMEAGVLIVF